MLLLLGGKDAAEDGGESLPSGGLNTHGENKRRSDSLLVRGDSRGKAGGFGGLTQ